MSTDLYQRQDIHDVLRAFYRADADLARLVAQLAAALPASDATVTDLVAVYQKGRMDQLCQVGRAFGIELVAREAEWVVARASA